MAKPVLAAARISPSYNTTRLAPPQAPHYLGGLGSIDVVCFSEVTHTQRLQAKMAPPPTSQQPVRTSPACVGPSTRWPWTYLASQRSLHNAPIFRLLLKVAVNGTHQCDFLNFCGGSGSQQLSRCILHRATTSGGPSYQASVLWNLDAVMCCVAVCYHQYMDA